MRIKTPLRHLLCVLTITLLASGLARAGEPDQLIADFDGPDYGDWTAEGAAFGPGPAAGTLPGQNPVSGYQGQGLVNSFFQGDATTGRLVSPPFTIERTHIKFLVGGGKYPGRTCINLVVDGQIVRTATGPNDRAGGSEQLAPHSWDVTAWRGKTAVIEIVDAATGSWGHINVDHIVQSNLSPRGGPSPMAEPSAADLEFFEQKIRPLLVKHCYECHSAESETLMAGLSLDSRAGMLHGGESGEVLLADDLAESPLLKAVKYEGLEMPPDGPLPAEQVALFARWVEMGAPFPGNSDTKPPVLRAEVDWDAARQEHWAFQPIGQPLPPNVANAAWVQSPIDNFVLSRLEAEGLKPVAPAAKRDLLRRVYFDLIGLPPTPEEVEEFLRDDRPGAFAEVVDRLLASPHYGERWGRHWLDVARYSDGYGGFLDSAELPYAYQYRDWVVAAFNRDLPYDQFIKQQIAGDLMEAPQSAAGPGFFAIGPTYKSDGDDPESIAQARSETLDDRIDTLSRGVLALTVSCARCHDHKFDPIPTLDYYSLAGVFNNTQNVDVPLADSDGVVRHSPQVTAAIAELERKLAARQDEVINNGRELSAAEEEESARWTAELDKLRKDVPKIHTLAETGEADMPVALRGNLLKPGEIAPRRFLRILAGADPAHFHRGSGRLDLADALVSADNPLTARVIVNRVWQRHFGQPLVRTPDNFGVNGESPTHPELLDWLATSLIRSGWSLKTLHRTILLSSSYQMSGDYAAEAFAVDGDNRLLWRVSPRRLDVESWRDALLAVTGELDPQLGGPPTRELLESRRRTLYSAISRNGDQFSSDEFLRTFDFPNPRTSNAQRNTSIVPQQYLFIMNSHFVVARAKALAARLAREAADDRARIERAYALLYSRPPTAEEIELGLAFLAAAPPSAPGANSTRWDQYAQVLLGANEMMHVR